METIHLHYPWFLQSPPSISCSITPPPHPPRSPSLLMFLFSPPTPPLQREMQPFLMSCTLSSGGNEMMPSEEGGGGGLKDASTLPARQHSFDSDEGAAVAGVHRHLPVKSGTNQRKSTFPPQTVSHRSATYR